MNYKSIFFFLAVYSILISFFSILNILYSIYFSFVLDLNSYLITLGVSLTFGISLYYLGHNYNKNITLIDQVTFIILGFIILPVFLSIPYYLSIYDISFIDSYFEAISGFTTTGFSIIETPQNLDEPLLLWRSSSQWLGGLLFIVSTIGTIGSRQAKIKPAYLISGGASGRNFYNNFSYNFIKILSIYFASTVLIIFLYTLVDIRLFDSFNLAFTTVSAGGFIPSNNLTNIVNNNSQVFIISLCLLFPIFNFFLLFDIITKKFSFKNHHEDIHLGAIIIFLIFIFYFFFVNEDEVFVNVFFSIVSSLSTSGIALATTNFDLSLFLILLTIVGGSLISSSSGYKYTRLYILLKISYQEIYRLVKPINIIDKNLFNNESKIDDQDVKIAFLAFISFVISIFILCSILTLNNINFDNSFKLSILTLTNTLSSSLYGLDNLTFFDLNSFTKVSLIIFMILGRIEIITVLYLIKRFIFRE